MKDKLFHRPDSRKVSARHQINIIQAFFAIHLCTEMKNKRALEIDRRANARASSEKSTFTKHLVGFWRDLDKIISIGNTMSCPLFKRWKS
jgi:hypothetical protein